MADRVLIWHIPADYPGPVSLPRYYMEADYEPGALRVYAEIAPVGDISIDIRADGISIFSNLATESFGTGGYRKTTPSSTVVLEKGENSEENAEDFGDVTIEKGQWVNCVISDLGGAKGVTFSLELRKVGEDTEEAE